MIVGIAPERLLAVVGSINEFVLESISDGFALYDADDRLVLSNSRYGNMMSSEGVRQLLPGTSFERIARGLLADGRIDLDGMPAESWLADWLVRHRNPGEPYIHRRTDGRWFRTSERWTKDGGIVAVCSDITEFKKTEKAAREDAAKFSQYLEAAPIAVWEEDWSRLKIRIDKLRNAGVTDLRGYLRDNPAIQSELVKEIRWKGFNEAAIDLYRADNRRSLEQYLSPAPVTAFAAYPEAIASFLEGHRQVAIDTTDRAVDGTELRIVETFQLPKEYDPAWSSVMSSSLDIAKLKQAEFAGRQRKVLIQDYDFGHARQVLPHLQRAETVGELLDLRTAQAATFGTVLDTLAVAVFLTDAELRIVHANTAGLTMLSQGDPVRSAGGFLKPRLQASGTALGAAVAQAGGNEAAIGGGGHGIPAPTADGTPHVLHVVPLKHSKLRPGLSANAVAAIFVTPAMGTSSASSDALTALFALTRAEARVLSKIAAGMTLPEVARSLNIEASTAKTHLLRIFGKTGTRRQVDLVRLVASLALPV